MGDRANVRVKYTGSQPAIYLYTHWAGTELPLTVKRALARKVRWDDEPYITRIIFCEMVKGSESSETGFGISPYLCDNEHSIIEVEPEKKTIRFFPYSYPADPKAEAFFTTTFERYVDMADAEIEALYAREI